MQEGLECNIYYTLVHAPIQELHDGRLEQVFEWLAKAGVTLNADKCIFKVPEIKFLGNVLSSDSIEVGPKTVAAVVNLPAPTNVHKVIVFSRMVNHRAPSE